MNRILITGHKGMLGQGLIAVCERVGKPWIGLDLPACDITSLKQVDHAVREAEPDLIIHAAAFTAVDRCESEADFAYLVNATGTQHVALLAAQLNVPLLYLSTDYVFDGTKSTIYDEWDAPNPLSQYGKSKLAGEFLVRSLCRKHYIVRISWLCGHGGANFVETMLKLAAERDELKVVNDQHGSPTFVDDLAPELIRLSEYGLFGTYHITNQGYTTWYDFARAILGQAGATTKILPCTTAEFPRPAPRPRNSRLSPRLYENAIGIRMPGWEAGLANYLRQRE